MIRVAGALLLLFVERLITSSARLSIWEWIIIQTLLLSIFPLLIIFSRGIKREEVGLIKGDLKLGLKYVGIMLFLAMPFMLYGASLPEFKSYYPIWDPARTNLFSFIALEAAVLIMMFNTEFFFRGILLFSLNRWFKKLKNGQAIAIIFHSVVYMIVHIGKPGLEVPYSFFVGIVFAWLALKTRSFLPTLVAHWTSSVIFDILVIKL